MTLICGATLGSSVAERTIILFVIDNNKYLL